MKELSIEEKAKAYDEAVINGSRLWESDIITRESYEYIFPELKEGEDERIRKNIKIALMSMEDNLAAFYSTHRTSQKELIAWLEKQIEKGTNGNEREIPNSEQKPDDKVATKFKVGDFIVNDYCMGRVVEITNDAYLLDTEQGIPFSCEHNAHLWTIQDAKDGDVLHSTGGHSDCIFIFNGLDNWRFDEPNGDRAVATGYCCLFVLADKMEFGIQGPDCVEVNTIKPATKKQRYLLFTKMKEAGYEWDTEKKELKKIEQESADNPDTLIEESNQQQTNTLINMVIEGKDMTEYNKGFECGKQRVLKYPEDFGLCKNSAWSEEDNIMARDIDYALRCQITYPISRLQSMSNWILNLKDRVQPQQQEWRKEIKEELNKIVKYLRYKGLEDDADFLESLNPQNKWKPSEEQMKAMEEVRTIFHNHHLWDEINPILYDYEELMRKLKSL